MLSSEHAVCVHFKNNNTNSVAIDILDIVINCYLVHFIAILGAFGNSITLIVLYREGFKDTSNIVLISLAGVDLCYLITLSVRKLSCVIYAFDYYSGHIYQLYTYTYVYVIGRLIMFISISHIAFISVERLLAVYCPLKVSTWFTNRNTTAIVMCIYLSWIIIMQPWLGFYRRIEWSFDTKYNHSCPSIVFTDWFTSNMSALSIVGYIVLNSSPCIFCCIITANCCALLYKLRLVAEQRSAMTSMNAKKSDVSVKVSRMLLTVCAVYCLCNVPSCVFYVFHQIFLMSALYQQLSSALRDFEEVLIAVNCTADFVIYTLLSAKFYNSVRKLFVCTRSETPQGLRKKKKKKECSVGGD
ncbi:unnamed protein product [Candidula unifasciata]|uniref:G-protein coupled receptors family 1 profile domain-containing protein n=1 Tax=Candidula unifasciata TaxID=100452 RepID=A0A8S3ZAL4_9EUPU|nr:unnamed protein product [Candidula unifasciata]